MLLADMIARIDGTYTEFFNNDTADYALMLKQFLLNFISMLLIITNLLLDFVTTKIPKAVKARATFYEIPLISNWNADAIAAGCGLQANGSNMARLIALDSKWFSS